MFSKGRLTCGSHINKLLISCTHFNFFRFASIVAKRLESLGALTHGDRRATESRDLSQFNLDTRYGRAALDIVLRTVIGVFDPPLIPPPSDYLPGDFFEGLFDSVS